MRIKKNLWKLLNQKIIGAASLKQVITDFTTGIYHVPPGPLHLWQADTQSPIVASSDLVVYIDVNNWGGGNDIELRSYSKNISDKI